MKSVPFHFNQNTNEFFFAGENSFRIQPGFGFLWGKTKAQVLRLLGEFRKLVAECIGLVSLSG